MAIPSHVHNVSLTDWAAASALLNQGFNQQAILTILNLELPVWHKASLAWNEALQTNQEIAEKYGSIYCQPFVGNFVQLQPKTRKHFNLNTYYNIFWHTQEVQKHGIDFLSILKSHHNIFWNEWSAMITENLNYQSHIRNNGTPQEKDQMQKDIQHYETHWQQHWEAYYRDKNLNLTSDINF